MRTAIAQLSLLSLATLAHIAACDPDLDAPTFRAGAPVLSIGDLVQELEPVPGGGGCEGCVTCFDRPGNGKSATMCVRPDTKFTGGQILAADDQAPLELGLMGVKWQLHAGSGAQPLCQGGSCIAFNGGLEDGFASLSIVGLKSNVVDPPTQIRFTSIKDQQWSEGMGPLVEIPAGIGPAPQPGLEPLAAGPVAPSSYTGAVAHITYPLNHGGLASCSGVLVAEDYVLTAAHCIARESSDIMNAMQSVCPALSIPTGFRVRIGGLGSPDSSSFPLDMQHTAKTIHLFPDGDVDLALIRLGEPSNAKPIPLIGLAHQISRPAAMYTAYGYGVSGVPAAPTQDAYDWGRLKRTPLAVCADTSVQNRFSNPHELMSFQPSIGEIGVCRGDSGGPVLGTFGAAERVVAIMILRVLGSSRVDFESEDIEMVAGRGFAWSRHNACGRASAAAYVAVRLDKPRIHGWLMSFLGSEPTTQCFAAEAS